MIDYEKLTLAGMDVDGFLKRLMGNASLIKVFVEKFISDHTFSKLSSSFKERDYHQAEIASHTLKGVCGNLSLNLLYSLFTEQVNLIRGGEYEKAESMMENLTDIYSKTTAIMSDWLAES